MKRGIITMAFGKDRYIKMAKCLGKSIKRINNEVSTDIVTDRIRENFESFDYKIKMDKKRGNGVTQKLYLNYYSPFDTTLFIDSDCIVYRDINIMWERFDSCGEFAVEIEGYARKEDDYKWSKNLEKTLEKSGIEKLPLYNGGVYYFKKSEITEKVMEKAREFYRRRKELGIKPFKNSPVNEETVIGMSIEKSKIEMPTFSGKIMGKSEYEYEKIKHVNVLDGECKHIRKGEQFNPVLIHYNIGRQTSYDYLKQIYMLEGGEGVFSRVNYFSKALLKSNYHDVKSRIKRTKERIDNIGFIGVLPAKILEKVGVMEK